MALHEKDRNHKISTIFIIIIPFVLLAGVFYFVVYEPNSHVYLKVDSLNKAPADFKPLTEHDMKTHPALWKAVNHSGAKTEITWDEYKEYVTFFGTNHLNVGYEGKYYTVWVETPL